MKRTSSRFTPSKAAEFLVPIILVILTLLLVSVLVLVALGAAGILH